MQGTFIKRIEMEMRNGSLLELDVTKELMESVRSAFCLSDISDVTDAQMKHFLISSMKNSLESFDGEE